MQDKDSIRPVGEIFVGQRIDLPQDSAVYAFWWLGAKADLVGSNRHIVLKGPGGKLVDVEYRDWWSEELIYPCLYVGKTTNVKKRFSRHIMRGSSGRLHDRHPRHHKLKPVNSSCQLRFGIEHIFPNDEDPLGLIYNSVGFSYRTDFPDNAIAERFFEEDRLVGIWRPWFNIDSER